MSALTKILIVLQLVFALVLSTLLVLFVSKADPYKTMVDQATAKNFALSAQVTKLQSEVADAKAQAAANLTAANKAINDRKETIDSSTAQAAKDQAALLELKNQVASSEAKVASLSNALATGNSTNSALLAELDKLRPQVQDLVTKYNDIYRSKREVDNQLAAAEQAIRKLQEQIAVLNTSGAGTGGSTNVMAASSADGHVTTLTQSIPTSAINATITRVDNDLGRAQFQIGLGTRDGIQKNTKLFVYRGNIFVADAVVSNVDPSQSVATVTNTKEGETVRVGDLVSPLSK